MPYHHRAAPRTTCPNSDRRPPPGKLLAWKRSGHTKRSTVRPLVRRSHRERLPRLWRRCVLRVRCVGPIWPTWDWWRRYGVRRDWRRRRESWRNCVVSLRRGLWMPISGFRLAAFRNGGWGRGKFQDVPFSDSLSDSPRRWYRTYWFVMSFLNGQRWSIFGSGDAWYILPLNRIAGRA